MSASEDLVIVDSTDYAQVVFDDVKECFSYDKPLTCVFTLNSLLRADKSDWIGIYKVGFTNCNEHLCIVPVSVDMIKDGKGKFTFQGRFWLFSFRFKPNKSIFQFVWPFSSWNVAQRRRWILSVCLRVTRQADPRRFSAISIQRQRFMWIHWRRRTRCSGCQVSCLDLFIYIFSFT